MTISDGTDPSVTVIQPNGGEGIGCTIATLSANAVDSDGFITDVEFSYSADGGGTWIVLGSGTQIDDNVYTYSWDVCGVANSDQCLIKAIATDNDGATGEDTSDSVFSINSNWEDEWIGLNSDDGSAITTPELQHAIHCWLDDELVCGHLITTPDLQWVIVTWLE